MKHIRFTAALCGALLAFSSVAIAADAVVPVAGRIPETLVREGTASVGRAVGFLLKRQAADGSFCDDPAITALCMMAIDRSGNACDEKVRLPAVEKARKYILSHVQKDGSIFIAGRRRAYPTYSTAIALTGLATLRRKEDEPVMLAARKFLISLQLDEDNADRPTQKNDPKYGGFGYGPGPQGADHTDLSNTQWVAEALHASEYLVREPKTNDPAPGKEADLAWDKLAQFVTKMQHLPETNKETWVVSDPKDDNYGGFVYQTEMNVPADKGPGGKPGMRPDGKGPFADGKRPDGMRPDGKPGMRPDGMKPDGKGPFADGKRPDGMRPDGKGPFADGKRPDGMKPDGKGPAEDRLPVSVKTGMKQTLRSYGSMTYAGLKSMIYAKVSKDDPRVKAAIEWAHKHYTLDENPGMGSAGHYYYLQTFAKAHSALGMDSFRLPDGSTHDWRADVIAKLLSLQRENGEWANDNNRYMERVPDLVTAYSLLTMEFALGPSLFED